MCGLYKILRNYLLDPAPPPEDAFGGFLAAAGGITQQNFPAAGKIFPFPGLNPKEYQEKAY